MMNELKSAFGAVHAPEALKAKTMERLAQKTRRCDRSTLRRLQLRQALPAMAACFGLFLAGIGGYLSYTIPVAAISIDINPSVELHINCYDRVIEVQGYNEDGIALASALDLTHMEYTEAIQAVMADETVTDLLESDNLLEVTVASDSPKTQEAVRTVLDGQPHASGHVYCAKNHEQIHRAHEEGLSFGKYRLVEEIQSSEPEFTTEEAKTLTMQQLRDRADGHGCQKHPDAGCHSSHEEAPSPAPAPESSHDSGCKEEHDSPHCPNRHQGHHRR